MSYTAYILKSELFGRTYVGHCFDLVERLDNHNRGSTKSTKPYRPWAVVYTEQYATKSQAAERERQIKAYKGEEAFKMLLDT